MNRDLIINTSSNEIAIALTEDGRLTELNKEKTNRSFTVGDIYLARVKKVMNGLNAAFVDVGYERDAFLHYLDLGKQIQTQQKFLESALNSVPNNILENLELLPEIDKKGKMSSILSGGDIILVQIAKEPISTKGPRLSGEISIPGRNLVLIPFSNKVSISQKIKSKEERIRLKNLILSIKPLNYGVIVRTVSKNRRVTSLDEELRALVQKWENAFKDLKATVVPRVLISELSRTSAILRDILNNSFNNIHVNDQETYDQVCEYVNSISPDQNKIVKLHKSDEPIFEHFGILKQIKSSFGKTVTIKTGAYIIIEHTEAMHVIDVNSGNRSKKTNSQETNALEVNLVAAEEIARQLRLRDMGGIIVVDFIDMHSGENRQKIFEKMREEMANDRTKHTILPLSKFGIMQITRQRVRPETNIETTETCPTCSGSGEISASVLFVDKIETHLSYICKTYKGKITLCVHPYIAGFLKQGFMSIQRKWFLKHKKFVKILPEMSYHFMEYRFLKADGEEIED